MKSRRLFSVFVLAAGVCVATDAAANLKDAKVAMRTGQWSVLHNIDTMTDKVTCTGIHGGDFNRQLSDQAFYVRIRGGIQSVNLRFGDEPQRPMRLPTKLEESGGVLMLDGSDLQDLLKTNRLRAAILTRFAGLQTIDIDVTGVADAFANIQAGCPIGTAGGANNNPGPAKREQCSTNIKSQMRAAGISPEKIAEACD